MIDLFKRFPISRVLIHEEQHLIPRREQLHYSDFTQEFEILEQELMPAFRELDNAAIAHQRWYRGMYMIMIFGSALVTILGIIQLVTDADGVGVVGTILAACLGLATLVVRTFHHQERYLNARLAAELLRSEYFLFLGQIEPYVDEQKRVQKLIERVADIKMKGENDHAA